MTKAASPQSITISKGSGANGVVTDYNFTITPTNFLKEGDIVTI
jgi:hypothetical protein